MSAPRSHDPFEAQSQPPSGDPNARETPDTNAPELIGAEAELIESPELLEVAAPMPLAAPPPPRREPRVAEPMIPEITAQDREFMQRVFLQVRDVDFRAPPPPPPRKDLAGPDKKIAALRQTVHELERDLARVGYIFGAMQQQFEMTDQIIASKEAERGAAVARYQQIKDLAAQTATRDRAEIDSLRRRVAELEQIKLTLEGDLQMTRAQAQQAAGDASARLARAEQERAALVADFRAKMEVAQQAFQQLREQSTRVIADTEGRLKRREEELTAKIQEAESIAASLEERNRALADSHAQIARYQQSVAQLEAEKGRLEAAVADRNRTLDTLAAELSRLREQHDSAVDDLRESMKLKDALIESTRNEVRSARNEFQQLAEQYELRRLEIEKLSGELATNRTEVERLMAELNAREAALDEAQTALVGAREDARLARADLEALSARMNEQSR